MSGALTNVQHRSTPDLVRIISSFEPGIGEPAHRAGKWPAGGAHVDGGIQELLAAASTTSCFRQRRETLPFLAFPLPCCQRPTCRCLWYCRSSRRPPGTTTYRCRRRSSQLVWTGRTPMRVHTMQLLLPSVDAARCPCPSMCRGPCRGEGRRELTRVRICVLEIIALETADENAPLATGGQNKAETLLRLREQTPQHCLRTRSFRFLRLSGSLLYSRFASLLSSPSLLSSCLLFAPLPDLRY